jgi:hypothetical protein
MCWEKIYDSVADFFSWIGMNKSYQGSSWFLFRYRKDSYNRKVYKNIYRNCFLSEKRFKKLLSWSIYLGGFSHSDDKNLAAAFEWSSELSSELSVSFFQFEFVLLVLKLRNSDYSHCCRIFEVIINQG